MSDLQSYWRVDRPLTGVYTSALMDQPACPIRTFLPDGYERRYAYPLLVLFHPSGSDADQALQLIPQLSQRNFVMVSLQGSEPVRQVSSQRGYTWNTESEPLTDYVLQAVAQTRRMYHIHSERVYLVGLNEGCAAAYRVAFELGEKIAGVVALNGTMPERIPDRPLFRWDRVRQLKALIARSEDNSQALQDYQLLNTAGSNVVLKTYNTRQRLHPQMLSDVNRWVMQHITSEPVRPAPQKVR